MEEPLFQETVDEDDASGLMAELLEEMENDDRQNPPQAAASLSPNNKRFSEIQAEVFAKELLEDDPNSHDHDELNRQAEEAMKEILQQDPHAQDQDELNRRAEEAMEEMLLAQEEEQQDNMDGFRIDGLLDEYEREEDDAQSDDDEHDDIIIQDDDMAFLDEEDNDNVNPGLAFHDTDEKRYPFTYVRVSLWAALLLVYYAFRSRQQWYLALVFLSSSKYAYVILGNAFVATLIWSFQMITNFFLNGLRLNEAEGLGDYFRWHITETCLALTIFRSELTVKTAMLFLCLVFFKCLHHIVDAREAHLRMTEEIVVANPNDRWISLKLPHVKLFVLITLLQLIDICAVVLCGQDIMKHGPSVSILFCFEFAIMLTSVISNALLWHLHLVDGILHHLHETSDSNHKWHGWIYPWKDYKATLVFAVELQAQFAKFLFYLTFFAVVFTYYGMPINLIRETYVSFLALKSRVVAFNKYRKLLHSMNRFENPDEEELEEEHICIICREEMTVETAKKLPGCGHIFHKSCLREWLVQQQTCPTCRGDISQMEARQKQQEALDARAQENAQEGEDQEEANHTESGQDENGELQEDENDRNHDESAEETIPAEETKEEEEEEASPPSLPEMEARKDLKPPPLVSEQPNTVLPIAASVETESFPAFYRVASNVGASVYRHEDDATAYLVTRVVPCGVVLLGTDREERTCILQKKSMIRMPDGWVNEDDVTRIAVVSLDSLLQQQ